MMDFAIHKKHFKKHVKNLSNAAIKTHHNDVYIYDMHTQDCKQNLALLVGDEFAQTNP